MSIRDLIIREAQAQGVDPNLALGVAHTESRLNQNAISPAGAIGVMQLMPGTAKDLGVNPRDLNQNIKGGVTYLRKMLDTFGGDVSKAVAAYNAGPGNVMKYGGIPPFKETQKYVPAVLSAANMTPPILPLEQTPSPQAQPGFSLDPQSLLPPAPPTMGKGMQTLLGVLGTIGMASGLAANVVSGLRGGPAVGNAGIQSGTGLLEQLANQQKAAQEYEQMQALASNQSIPENVRSALMLGGKQQVASSLLQEPKDPVARKLQEQQVALNEQTLFDRSPAGKQAQLQNEIAKARALSEFKGTSEGSDLAREVKLGQIRRQYTESTSGKRLNQSENQVLPMLELWEAYQSNPQSFETKNGLDNALINTFQKILDPESVVRESEYERIPEGLSLKSRLKAYKERQFMGGVLDDQARKDLVTVAQIYLEGRLKSMKSTIDVANDQAKRLGVNPDDVFPLSAQTRTTYNVISHPLYKKYQSKILYLTPEEKLEYLELQKNK